MDSDKNVSVPRWKYDYFTTMCEGLEQQWTNSQHTDTQVNIGNKSFDCHKVVLSAMSPFFEAMYLSGMRECQDGIVNIQEVETQTFENILRFIYTGENILTEENVESVLRASVMMQIKCLRESCEMFMADNVDVDNCLATWKLASSHECRYLARAAWDYILFYFEDVCETEDFVRLECDDILTVIKDNDLRVCNEESVCEAVLRWLDHDQVSRKQYVGLLFEQLRLPLMQPEYLIETLDLHELVGENEECKLYIDEAKRYHLLPARKHELCSARLRQRNGAMYEDVVLCIGGNVHLDTRSGEVSAYSLKQNIWVHMEPMPYDPGVEFAVCSYGDAVFLSGGSENLRGLSCFMTVQNKWTPCARMYIGRRRHCMVAAGDSLYVLGGFDDEEAAQQLSTLMSVEKFVIMSGKWEDCGYLTLPVRSASASVLHDRIFVFGGIDGDGNQLSAVQCFDTRLRTCSRVSDLPGHSGLSSTVVCNRITFLIFPNGDVLRMQSSGDLELLGNIAKFYRCGFGVVQHEGRLLVMGGIDSSNNSIFDEIITFEPDNNNVSVLDQEMIRPLFGFGCVKARVQSIMFVNPESDDDINTYQNEKITFSHEWS